jgi:hypothetical protein
VSREEQREGLVADLFVAHAGSVLARSEQQGEVVAGGARLPALGDHLGDHAVQVRFDPPVAALSWASRRTRSRNSGE